MTSKDSDVSPVLYLTDSTLAQRGKIIDSVRHVLLREKTDHVLGSACDE